VIWFPLPGLDDGQVQADHDPVLHGPVQERPDGVLLVFQVGGVPDVDIGLGAGAWRAAAAVDPGQEGAGSGELLAGEPARRCGERVAICPRSQPRELFPGGEPAQQPLVRVAIELGEPVHQPGLKMQELLVDGGQCPAGHEEITQVGDGPPIRKQVERLVGEGQPAGRQI
jgi:hypothetical protein